MSAPSANAFSGAAHGASPISAPPGPEGSEDVTKTIKNAGGRPRGHRGRHLSAARDNAVHREAQRKRDAASRAPKVRGLSPPACYESPRQRPPPSSRPVQLPSSDPSHAPAPSAAAAPPPGVARGVEVPTPVPTPVSGPGSVGCPVVQYPTGVAACLSTASTRSAVPPAAPLAVPSLPVPLSASAPPLTEPAASPHHAHAATAARAAVGMAPGVRVRCSLAEDVGSTTCPPPPLPSPSSAQRLPSLCRRRRAYGLVNTLSPRLASGEPEPQAGGRDGGREAAPRGRRNGGVGAQPHNRSDTAGTRSVPAVSQRLRLGRVSQPYGDFNDRI